MSWNIAAILTACIAFIESMPRLIEAGVDIYKAAQDFTAVLRKVRDEKRDPTDEEWVTLNGKLDADEKKLQTDDQPVPAVGIEPVTAEDLHVEQPRTSPAPGESAGE